jgi:hypothetical protein
MEHQPLNELRSIADVQLASMTRRERLERWVELLDREPLRRLMSLGEIEFRPRAERHMMRADNSPLTVAFEDPVLRAEGLTGDRLGDAIKFFELSEGQAHRVLCSCLNGQATQARTFAARVRRIATGGLRLPRVAWTVAGAITALPALLYLLR